LTDPDEKEIGPDDNILVHGVGNQQDEAEQAQAGAEPEDDE
jgi:hypothetical protein